MTRTIQLIAIVFVCCVLVTAQTPANAKNFAKDNLSFDYANGWTLTDDSNNDAQQLTLPVFQFGGVLLEKIKQVLFWQAEAALFRLHVRGLG